MIDTIYVERDASDHPRTQSIVAKLPKADVVPISRYGEVFNRNQQSFRLQKRRPSLILAVKHDSHVLDAPEGYGIGRGTNYYFSHVLNCLYDCRYCFLQGMYRSAHYVVFVNYEDFFDAILTRIDAHRDDSYFFSGYDGDSLALDHITGFIDAVVPFFARHERAFVELRTKSAAVRPLLSHEPSDNVIAAFSFTPPAYARALEQGVPPLEARLSAMEKLAARGYRLGLRFDPLLYAHDYRERYRELFEAIFTRIEAVHFHSVSFGPFRVPRDFFRRMVRLYPEERLFAGLDESARMVSYPVDIETEMRAWCQETLSELVQPSTLFPCRI